MWCTWARWVYRAYGTAGVRIPEGYLRMLMEGEDGTLVGSEILYPPIPGRSTT